MARQSLILASETWGEKSVGGCFQGFDNDNDN